MKRLLVLMLLAGSPVSALELALPNAVEARSETLPQGRIRLPDAPWSPDSAPAPAEGEITRRVLHVPIGAMTPLQLVAGLRTTLEEEGFDEVFACANAACGGFDFRFQLDILGEPDMHVDLRNFVYLLMRNPRSDASPHTVSLLASRTQTTGFVHITTVSIPSAPPAPGIAPEPDQTPPQLVPQAPDDGKEPQDIIHSLAFRGRAVLEGLDFGTGSAELNGGPYPSLETLATWLARNPSARVILVGHTDSIGSLEANTALSQRRAAAVAQRLQTQYGVNPAQVQSAGAGYLAPRASNLVEEGRALNRRVEVVLLSVD